MNAWIKWVAVVSALVSFSVANAAGEGVIDTGKGGLRAVLVSEMAGPKDFANNSGAKVVGKNSGRGFVVGEVMFNGDISQTSVLVAKLLVMHASKIESGDKPITADHMANELLKTTGFDLSRAEKIAGPTPPNLPPGAEVVTYKASGHAVFETVKKNSKEYSIVQGVSYPGKAKGYAIMVTALEKNVPAFDADPEKYLKEAKGGFMPIFRGLTVTENK